MEVMILGVNEAGHESGNAAAVAGRDIPWLQDEPGTDAWGDWNVTYRDVIILDAHQEISAVYNLTTHDLSLAANRDELKRLLREAAARP